LSKTEKNAKGFLPDACKVVPFLSQHLSVTVWLPTSSLNDIMSVYPLYIDITF